MKKLPVLDTNIIIKFLTGDSLNQAHKVKNLLSSAPKRSVVLTDIIIAEIIYVLSSFYKLSKENIIEKIEMLIEVDSIKCSKSLIIKALAVFKDNNISFVDAYLCALILTGKNSTLYSFDKRLGKVLGSKATEPNTYLHNN